MKNNVSDIKPWFPDDLRRLYSSLYFAFVTSNPNRRDVKARAGFLNGIAATALQTGVDPKDFLSADDLEIMRKWQAGEL